MKLTDVLLLLLLVILWAFNFVTIKVGLDHIPPMTFASSRFLFVAFPAIFFIKKPNLPWSKIAAYGFVMFAGQFTFVFSAIHAGLSAGLTSLVMQMQMFFTIGFSMLLFREKPLPFQLVGAAVAACGIAVVAMHTGGQVTLLGLALALISSMCWGAGNLITKSMGKADMMAVVIWGSLFACLPLMTLAAILERHELSLSIVTNAPLAVAFAVGYNAYAACLIGYTLWSRALARYPAALVTPFPLLVPVVSMIFMAVLLDETYFLWKFHATLLILLGLCINQFGEKILSLLKPAPAPD